MLGFWQRPKFDSDTLSSIWVMACRDESPVLTAFSVAYRLRGISPEDVIELVKSRQELFRLVTENSAVRLRAYTEPFYTHGTLHGLADDGRVGWHPDFQARLEALLLGGAT